MTIEQACPLCDKPATYTVSHDPFCKHFTCPVCSEFFIDESSEKYLNELVEVFKTEHRKRLSDMAKNGDDDRRLVMREPSYKELAGDGHGVARTTMIVEWSSPMK